jgi:hypothetical protein
VVLTSTDGRSLLPFDYDGMRRVFVALFKVLASEVSFGRLVVSEPRRGRLLLDSTVSLEVFVTTNTAMVCSALGICGLCFPAVRLDVVPCRVQSPSLQSEIMSSASTIGPSYSSSVTSSVTSVSVAVVSASPSPKSHEKGSNTGRDLTPPCLLALHSFALIPVCVCVFRCDSCRCDSAR